MHVSAVIKHLSGWFPYLKLFKENLGECLPEVRRAEDGLDDDHPSVARIHQQVPDWDKWEDKLWFDEAGPLHFSSKSGICYL